MDGTQYVIEQLGLALAASHDAVSQQAQHIAALRAEAEELRDSPVGDGWSYNDGTIKVAQVPDGAFVVAHSGVWMPGEFDSVTAAIAGATETPNATAELPKEAAHVPESDNETEEMQ